MKRAAVAALLALTFACGRSDRAPGDATLTLLYPAGNRAFGLPEDDQPRYLVHLPLVLFGEDGEPIGGLLQRAERKDMTDTWIYHLRTDVRWHDGVPFTARDVMFTLELKQDPAVGWITPGRFDARFVDDSTFEVTYHEYPYGNLLHLNDWEVFYPEHLLAGLDREDFGSWAYWVRPVGNGPYRIVRHIPHTAFVLQRVADYCCGTPRIGRVVLRLGEPSLPQLLSGEVDAMPLDLLSAEKLRDDERFRVHYAIDAGDRFALAFQQDSSLFADPRVRRALALAIDRNELHDALGLPDHLLISDGVFTRHQYLQGEPTEGLRYDPDGAAALLDDAGWHDTDGDHVRDRDGRPFRFTAVVGSDGRAAAVFVQEQLRRQGIVMNIQPSPESEMVIHRVLQGRFEAVLFPVRNDLRGRRGLASLFRGGAAAGGARWTFPLGYRNPRVVALIEALDAALYPREIDSLYRELSPEIERDLPMVFLAPWVQAWVAHRRVRGLHGRVFALPFYRGQDLWLEEDARPADEGRR